MSSDTVTTVNAVVSIHIIDITNYHHNNLIAVAVLRKRFVDEQSHFLRVRYNQQHKHQYNFVQQHCKSETVKVRGIQ